MAASIQQQVNTNLAAQSKLINTNEIALYFVCEVLEMDVSFLCVGSIVNLSNC